MKKWYVVAVMAIFIFSSGNAQNVSFGVTGGLFYGSADVSVAGIDVGSQFSDLEVLDGGGFYIGLLADIDIIEKFHIQPEALYANAAGESVIVIPVMFKYYIADSFNLQAGPQLDFVLDVPALVDEFVNSTGFSLGVGAGYDITEKIGVQAKYTFGLTNRVSDKINDLFDIPGLGVLNPSLKTNILYVGVVYKF